MSHSSDQSELATASSRLKPSDRKRLLKRIEADLALMARCQQGAHQMQATRSPGVFVCHRCRTLGVCPWCGLIPPDGACITVCPTHRETVAWQAAHADPQPTTAEGDR